MKTNHNGLWVSARTMVGLLCAWLVMAPALAHEGEDHSKGAKSKPAAAGATIATAGAASREAPARLSDGSLFVPKTVQHQWGLRTARIALGDLSVTVELNGRVLSEAGAGGRIQATQSGTVMAGPRGFPTPGTRVRKGEVVAWLQPTVSSLESSSQRAEQADLAAQLVLAERRAERLAQLEGSVPAKEVEAAHIEARAMRDRLAARRTGLGVAQALTAPTSGVIGSVHVVAGEVVDAKDLVLEIVDPSRLAVEALAYDPALASKMGPASLHDGLAGEARLQLRLVGAGLQLREQALPMVFKILQSSVPVAVGQQVIVFARQAASGQGITVPKSALTMNGAGEAIVWVHSEPERFEPRRVKHRTLGVDSVAISVGLSAGERVVVDGATLLAQVR